MGNLKNAIRIDSDPNTRPEDEGMAPVPELMEGPDGRVWDFIWAGR